MKTLAAAVLFPPVLAFVSLYIINQRKAFQILTTFDVKLIKTSI